MRERLPDTRQGITHTFSVPDDTPFVCTFYVGLFPDGRPAELFTWTTPYSTERDGFIRAWATAFSIALQYGAPAHVMATKFSFWKFSPCGFTGNPSIPSAHSIVDYISRWITQQFNKTQSPSGITPPETEKGQSCQNNGRLADNVNTRKEEAGK